MVAPPRPRRQPLRHRFQHLPPRLRLKRVGSHPAHFRAHCLCIRCYLPASLRALQCLRQHHGAQCPRLTWSRCSLRRRCNQCRCSSRRCRGFVPIQHLQSVYQASPSTYTPQQATAFGYATPRHGGSSFSPPGFDAPFSPPSAQVPPIPPPMQLSSHRPMQPMQPLIPPPLQPVQMLQQQKNLMLS